MDQLARQLADAIESAIPDWVVRSVQRVLNDQGCAPDDATIAQAAAAGRDAVAAVAPDLRDALGADVDERRESPLSVVRRAVPYPTRVLREAGARAVARDDFQQRHFPDDDYDLMPASWADLGPEVAELGIAWGAARAHAHLTRRAQAR